MKGAQGVGFRVWDSQGLGSEALGKVSGYFSPNEE